MMTTNKIVKTKKMNSYLKIILGMIGGGIFGGVLGLCSAMFLEDGVKGLVEAATQGISTHVMEIMLFLAAVGLLTCLLCYWKCETLIRSAREQEDDEAQDALDWKYDIWNTVGTTCSNTILIISMIVFPFVTISGGKLPGTRMWWSVGLFLLSGLVCTAYQVAMVKQYRRKDPTKKGDAADLNFQKQWMASCDEAEKEVIYQTSYRTFQFLKVFLMGLFLIALMAQVLLGSGLAAVVFLGIAYVGMMIAYSIYAMIIQKKNLSK